MKTISRTMVACAALAAAGCTTNLPGGSLVETFTSAESFLGETIGGSSFNDALAREYQQIAAYNANTEVNWLDTTVYMGRSRAAASGSPMPLYDPADFGVNGDAAALRATTLANVDRYAGDRPAECAKMMALYDFYVESLYQAPGQDPEAARAQYDAAATACTGVQVGDMTVFFGFASSALTAAANSVIQDVVSAIGGASKAVSLVGHTDTVGSLDFNQRLSERRAFAVRDRMVDLGVPAGDITTAGRSWTEPAVDTGPNVREARNRRVEITVSD
jgi:outer membrane protein OmpA-like peptidoglycan-associated protein